MIPFTIGVVLGAFCGMILMSCLYMSRDDS